VAFGLSSALEFLLALGLEFLLSFVLVFALSFRAYRLPMLDQKPSQMLDHLQQCLARLLHQHVPQQNSERANIAPERKFFGRIGGRSGELQKTRPLVLRCP
jgi:hypothetical protein